MRIDDPSTEISTRQSLDAGTRVLVVHDDPAERQAVVSALERDGIDAVGASASLGEVDGSFDLVVVSPVGSADLVALVQNLRAMRALASRDVSDGSLEGPGGLRLLPKSRDVSLNGRSVALSPKECAVLQVLLERRNEVLSRDDIAVAVWGYPTFGSPNFVEAQISRLRSKLNLIGAGAAMQTIRGEGYVIPTHESALLVG